MDAFHVVPAVMGLSRRSAWWKPALCSVSRLRGIMYLLCRPPISRRERYSAQRQFIVMLKQEHGGADEVNGALKYDIHSPPKMLLASRYISCASPLPLSRASTSFPSCPGFPWRSYDLCAIGPVSHGSVSYLAWIIVPAGIPSISAAYN